MTDLHKAIETTRHAARDNARDAAQRTSQSIESNPLSVLVGGVALGVLAGAFLPKTKRETDLLRPVGKRITDTATAAARAARDAGKSELDSLGLKSAAKDQARSILDGVFKAVSSAGGAAAQAAAKK